MDRRSKLILGLFLAVLLGIIATEIARPKPLNWRPSYTATDKIPFGCFVLFSELPHLFPQMPITKVESSLYDVLAQRDTTAFANYLLINDDISLDEQESEQLLHYVSQGNDAFIAATEFGSHLSDTLNLAVQSFYGIVEDTVTVSLVHPAFKNNAYQYARGQQKTHFTSLDTLHTTILGHVSFDGKEKVVPNSDKRDRAVNFVKVKFGKGHFYLNTLPQAYTNYYLLKGQQDYVAHTFSYLQNRPLYWDNYKKSGRTLIDSPMRFVLTQVSLKWAYYLGIAGLLLFVVFKAKREQRIIPVIEPLQNSSVAFAKTIGGLYYQNKDYTDLIFKKINYFMEFIRHTYYMDTTALNDKTAQDLAAKSGKSLTETNALLDHIAHLKHKKEHTVQDLVELNKKITLFKH